MKKSRDKSRCFNVLPWGKRSNKGMGKRGFLDFIVIIVVLLILAVGIIVASTLMNKLRDNLGPMLDNPESTEALEKGSNTILMFDNLFVVIYAFIVVYLIVTSFFIRSHPIFFFIGLLFMAIVIFLSPIISNVYQQVVQTPGDLNVTANQFETTNYFFQHLPLFIGVGIAIVLLVTITKPWERFGGVV